MSNNLTDLDLSKIDSADVDQLAQKIETFYKQDNAQKSALSYHWEKNHLFLDGRQWLVFEGDRERGGTWRQLTPNPQNEYIPRPVTNYIFDAYQTLKSYLLKQKPRLTVRPNTQTNKDKVAAQIAELVTETNWERLREDYNMEYAASILVTYGTVFKKDFWDSSFASMAKVPKMEQRPVTDPQTGQPTGQIEEVQAMDPMTGAPLYDEIPLGDVGTSVVEPYKIALDPLAINLHEARWIMEYSIRPLSWIVENYSKQEPGYTGKAEEVKEEKSLPNSLRRFWQLRTSSGVKGGMGQSGGGGSSSGSEMIDNAAVVKEYYERPSMKNPKGRLIVVANGVVLFAADSPYSGPEQGEWHPYSECRWEIVPGRFWGKSPFDDATEIQKHINSIDAVTILTRKTMAVPQKLVPHGSIPVGGWTGMPGQQISYKPGPNGEIPSIVPASDVGQQIFQERAQKVEDFKAITGAIDILKGDRPPGVSAASAIALLFEVGTGKLFPMLDRWKMFIEGGQKKRLRLVANKYREPRPDFIRMLLAKNRDLTEDEIKNFIGEDLHDNCNVVMEASSSIPKLKAAEHALLLELASQGLLNLENPANRQEFLGRFGINGFDADYSKDVKRAQWENDLIDNIQNSPDNKPIVLQTDDHQVHIATHSDRTKDPSFMSLPFEVQQVYFAHLREHEEMAAEAEQQKMMQAAAMGTPPAPPAPNPMQAQQHVSKGKGVDEKTRKLLTGDMYGPSAGIEK